MMATAGAATPENAALKTEQRASNPLQSGRFHFPKEHPVQDNPSIIDVNEQNIQQVLEASRQIPVLFDFWASWCQPCQQMAPLLEKLANEYQGKLVLARVNADEQQAIASQFGVRSLPSLKLVYQGQLVNELDGAQTEGALRQWLAPVLDPDAAEKEQEEGFLEQIRMAISAGHGDQAEQALRQTLEQQPDKHAFRALLVEFLLGEGRLDEAQSVLAEIAEDVEELRPFRARFALLEKVQGNGESLTELAQRIQNQPQPEDLHAYGLRAAAAGQFEAGLEALLTLLRDHPDYQDGAARAALLQVFDCLPKGDPLASQYRRRMFTYLY
ncbi:tetratricopeptide repeat protein [Alloalcanivorax mobilis]|uniref:tetratricopeptide repeat protein n=1 Tax=Alloalcanivorax mobilis TaxID=2019569 RepID=UPI002FCDC077